MYIRDVVMLCSHAASPSTKPLMPSWVPFLLSSKIIKSKSLTFKSSPSRSHKLTVQVLSKSILFICLCICLLTLFNYLQITWYQHSKVMFLFNCLQMLHKQVVALVTWYTPYTDMHYIALSHIEFHLPHFVQIHSVSRSAFSTAPSLMAISKMYELNFSLTKCQHLSKWLAA